MVGFLPKNIAFSGFKRALLALIMSPAVENNLSDGVLVAEMQSVSLLVLLL